MEEDMISVITDINVNKRVNNKFKGVVPQSNGHWGAQIYANHQRIWLGTFKSEVDAAMAYDSASIKLRTGDNQRNFPWSDITIHEPKFQSLHSVDAILNMIRDGSYPSKFSYFVHSQVGGQQQDLQLNIASNEFSCEFLFQKELTPSDVSKLNRLVVPKKYAVKYFPQVGNGNDQENNNAEEAYLFFYDRMMRLWKFRYCYWKSSQSFVFTRGWNKFVKEKELKTNDTIAFYVCEGKGRAKNGQSFWLIDIVCPTNGRVGGEVEGQNVVDARVDTIDVGEVEEQNNDIRMDVCLSLGQPTVKNKEKEVFDDDDRVSERSEPSTTTPRRSVRIFGVDIHEEII